MARVIADIRHRQHRILRQCRNHRQILGIPGHQGQRGGIGIREGADGTDANLSNKNLLLSADAEIDTQPTLVIDADEVKAAHGATVGQLAALEPDSLRFCFDLVMKDSIAEGAVLQIDSLPGRGWCARCAEAVPIAALYDACPRCGSYQVQASGGTEMRVKELEIE